MGHVVSTAPNESCIAIETDTADFEDISSSTVYMGMTKVAGESNSDAQLTDIFSHFQINDLSMPKLISVNINNLVDNGWCDTFSSTYSPTISIESTQILVIPGD